MTIFKESGKDGKEWTINEKYSYKDLTDMDFTSIDPVEFSNMAIIGSCFYQTYRDGFFPPYPVFNSGVENMRLIACNLDNVQITEEMDISDDGWNKNTNAVIVG